MHTIEQLNDGRAVYLNGHRVNVADVPIFRKTLALNNQYYDLQHNHPEVHTYQENGHRYDIAFKVPRTVADLQQKHRAYQEIAQSNSGMLGRTPDFLNTGMAVLAERAAFLGQNQYTDLQLMPAITLRRSKLTISSLAMRFKTHNSTVKKPSMPFRLDTRVFIPLNVIKMESSFLVPKWSIRWPQLLMTS
ncbi:4-hydroxyphenylacetate-3-hydroxylase [Lactiplantibacillus plantarum subsp. plantarum]|nr:4-hydroxyphenylacetate-3-hydroxylase [Lactiplantibacillus plantarum subsp. plantarum]